MIALLLAATLAAAPAIKEDPDRPQAIADKPQVTLDPARAYLFYTGDKAGQAVKLFRVPDDGDIADYKARRDEAMAKAMRRYERKLASWTALNKRGQSAGAKPVAPIDATLAFPPIEFGLMVDMGPLYRFAKSETQSAYLEAVKPGDYVVYGPIFVAAQGGAIGQCLCMGTVRFRAEAGKITHLGRMVDNYVAARRAVTSGGDRPDDIFDLPDGITAFSIEPVAAPGMPDPRLTSLPVVAADYRASGKLTNWYGIGVDRLTAMPGVLAYDRDRVVDLKATGGAEGQR